MSYNPFQLISNINSSITGWFYKSKTEQITQSKSIPLKSMGVLVQVQKVDITGNISCELDIDLSMENGLERRMQYRDRLQSNNNNNNYTIWNSNNTPFIHKLVISALLNNKRGWQMVTNQQKLIKYHVKSKTDNDDFDVLDHNTRLQKGLVELKPIIKREF